MSDTDTTDVDDFDGDPWFQWTLPGERLLVLAPITDELAAAEGVDSWGYWLRLINNSGHDELLAQCPNLEARERLVEILCERFGPWDQNP